MLAQRVTQAQIQGISQTQSQVNSGTNTANGGTGSNGGSTGGIVPNGAFPGSNNNPFVIMPSPNTGSQASQAGKGQPVLDATANNPNSQTNSNQGSTTINQGSTTNNQGSTTNNQAQTSQTSQASTSQTSASNQGGQGQPILDSQQGTINTQQNNQQGTFTNNIPTNPTFNPFTPQPIPNCIQASSNNPSTCLQCLPNYVPINTSCIFISPLC